MSSIEEVGSMSLTDAQIDACAGRPTAGQLIRQGLVPCEVNPFTGGLSRTSDPAHALAAFTITGRGFESRHICRECAMEFYANRPIKEGIHWS